MGSDGRAGLAREGLCLSGADLPIAISASMGVTHSYWHYLQEKFAAIYHPASAEIPEEMMEQIARLSRFLVMRPLL